MKKLTLIFVAIILIAFSGQTFGQETTTNKAVRVYVGYFGVVGPESHHGPSAYFSFPLNKMKLRLGFFGRSVAWGTYESRGGFIQLSKLISHPESDIKFRLNLETTFSAENLVGETDLPHKMVTVTGGGSIVFDPVKNFSIEFSSGIGYGTMVSLPKNSLVNSNKTSVALSLSLSASYFF